MPIELLSPRYCSTSRIDHYFLNWSTIEVSVAASGDGAISTCSIFLKIFFIMLHRHCCRRHWIDFCDIGRTTTAVTTNHHDNCHVRKTIWGNSAKSMDSLTLWSCCDTVTRILVKMLLAAGASSTIIGERNWVDTGSTNLLLRLLQLKTENQQLYWDSNCCELDCWTVICGNSPFLMCEREWMPNPTIIYVREQGNNSVRKEVCTK